MPAERLVPPSGDTGSTSEYRLSELANEIRRRTLLGALKAETGHVGGCSAAVELFTALYFGDVLRYDPADPWAAHRDRVLVRGHLGPVRYAIFSLLGWVGLDELAGYATLGSRLQGHETPDLPGIDIGPSGSLGMLLSYGLGSAVVAANTADPWRTFVFLGDGEEQEGNIAEAARHAATVSARNLVAIIDANGKQLSGPVEHADRADVSSVWKAYGWEVIDLPDGNDVVAAFQALTRAAAASVLGPVVVVARTTKGYGIAGAEAHFSGFHELSHSGPEIIHQALNALGVATGFDQRNPVAVSVAGDAGLSDETAQELPNVGSAWGEWPDDFQVAYFTDLARLRNAPVAGRGHLYFLFADTFPEPLLSRTGLSGAAWCSNVGIREQHLVALAHGIASSDPRAVVIAHTGDAFLLRAADQLAAAASVGSRFVLIADDAGITNSRNGLSHQSSLQPLLISAIPGVHLCDVADGADFAGVMNHALGSQEGIWYVRIHDGRLSAFLSVPAGDRSIEFYTAREPISAPDVVIAASGFFVGEAIRAAWLLGERGLSARVINVVSPRTAGKAVEPAIMAGTPVVTVYDGHPDVLANPVRAHAADLHQPPRLRALGFVHGTSGRLEELLRWARLDAEAIMAECARLAGSVGTGALRAQR
jgi:transketolase